METLERLAMKAALAGSRVIMDYYAKGTEVEWKPDNSPVTEADRDSQAAIFEILKDSGLPLLGEEGECEAYHSRKDWSEYWCVDPLDGTKEFIARNDEFCTNIALIRNNVPCFGVVLAPALHKIYYTSGGVTRFSTIDPNDESKNNVDAIHERSFVFDKSEAKPLSVKANGKQVLKIGVSRSHRGSRTDDYVEKLEEIGYEVLLVPMGSALKLAAVSVGELDLYPRFGNTMEWDTAAADALCRLTGARVEQVDGSDLKYNKEDLVNPHFIGYSPGLDL